MSAITVTLASICSGGGHLTFNVTGDATFSKMIDLSTMTGPMDEQDVLSFLRVIGWLAKNGRTVAQAKALLQAGVTVTV